MKKTILTVLLVFLASNNLFLLSYGAYQYMKAGKEADQAQASNILDSVLVFAGRLYDTAAAPAELSGDMELLGAQCRYQIKTVDGKRSIITVSADYKGRKYERVYLNSL